MPQSNKAAGQSQQAAQPDTNAQQAQATTRTEDGGQRTGRNALMDALEIHPDVQAQIAPKEEAGENAQRSTPNAQRPTGEEPQDDPNADPIADPNGEPTDDPQANLDPQDDLNADPADDPNADPNDDPTDPDPNEPQGQQRDKRQKRIDRLTRQKRELEAALDEKDQLIAQYEQHLAAQQQQNNGAPPAPVGAGVLGNVGNEQQLAQVVNEANAVLQWCDANKAGVEIGEGESKQFLDAEAIADKRRHAEYILLNAPIRQKQLEQFGIARNHFSQLARTEFPEVFDASGNWKKDTREYQVAHTLLREFPYLNAHPARDFALNVMIEGYKALEQRRSQKSEGRRQNGNGENKRHLDPRVLNTPRVPLAPHSAKPPGRSADPSPTKKVDEAKQAVLAGGGDDALVNYIAARDAAKKTAAGNPRALVTA